MFADDCPGRESEPASGTVGLGDLDLLRLEEEEQEDREGEGTLKLEEEGARERVPGTRRLSRSGDVVSSSWSNQSVKGLWSCSSLILMELVWMVVSVNDVASFVLYMCNIYSSAVLPEVIVLISAVES